MEALSGKFSRGGSGTPSPACSTVRAVSANVQYMQSYQQQDNATTKGVKCAADAMDHKKYVPYQTAYYVCKGDVYPLTSPISYDGVQ